MSDSRAKVAAIREEDGLVRVNDRNRKVAVRRLNQDLGSPNIAEYARKQATARAAVVQQVAVN
jgi:hypothetical protein